MTLILNGTDNSATTPAVTGTDTDTGVFFPAANVVAFATAGTEDGRFDANGNLLVGSTTAAGRIFSYSPSNQWGLYAENGLGSGLNSGLLALVSAQNSTNNSYKAIVYYNAGAGQDRFSVADSGAIATAGSIALGTNGSPPTSGIGVQFPATQVASSNANTLDDYEEGTWTPTINLLGTLTYGAQNGTYVKIGGLVTVSYYVIVSSTDSTQDGSIMSISGLPFTATADSGYVCAMTERMYGTNAPTAPNAFFVQAGNGGASLNLFQNNYNGGLTNASYFVSQIRTGYKGGNMYVLGTMSYRAS